MKLKRVLVLLTAILCFVCSSVCFAQEEEIAPDLEIDLSFPYFCRSLTAHYEDGLYILDSLNGLNSNGEDPAIFSPDISIDASKYRYIKLEIKNNFDKDAKIGFYFKRSDLKWTEATRVSYSLKKVNEDFVTCTFDMESNANWKGTITGLFLSFTDVKGNGVIRSAHLEADKSDKTFHLKDEEKIKDIPDVEYPTVDMSFTKERRYDNGFTDVTAQDWFSEAVANAYEFGLVNGVSDTSYNPKGTMTVAEAVTLAVRINAMGNRQVLEVQSGEKWYSGYVEAAMENGIISEGDFSDYNAPIKRGQMAILFAKALPYQFYPAVNYVTHIPDVAKDSEEYDAVMLLYNAGICMGNDIYGTFNPNSNINRAEVAALVHRIADANVRLDKDLAVKVDSERAFWLVDDSGYSSQNTVSQTLQSGWDYDIRGSAVKIEDEPPYALSDISDKEPVTLTRTLNVVDKGVITLHTAVRMNTGDSGWYMELCSTDGRAAVRLEINDGSFCVVQDGKAIDTGVKAGSGVYNRVKVIADLDKKLYTLAIQNKEIAEYSFANKVYDVALYRTGTTNEAVCDVTLGNLKMSCNYAVNEFIEIGNGKGLPYDWEYTQSGDVKADSKEYEIVFEGNTGKAQLYKEFSPITGEVASQLIMLYPENGDGFEYALTSGGKDIVTFSAKGGKFLVNGKELRSYTGNMWYMVRIVADTASQTAQIKVSGKTVAKDVAFGFKADSIDGVRISSSDNGGKALRVDDIVVEKLIRYDDYPTEPELPEGADDYIIGINVCNMWRNGYHWGWDNISPYDAHKPYLGWYDEGLPEVADWEIKYMTEHGIDFQLVCWFHSDEYPMKSFYGAASKALLEGFMNAEYSDEYGKFALLWEVSGGVKPKSLEDFKERFVEFWVEYFFTDPRYMTIDNKLVMSVFRPDVLSQSLGGDEVVKQAFDYLRERVKQLGFDDVIIMASNGATDTATLEGFSKMGFDAICAYSWGTSGSSAEVNQINISNQQKNGVGLIHTVPTASTGFNSLPWAYVKYGQISTQNLKQVLTWIRDGALQKYKVEDESEAWKQKFVMLSTWNEYGEGTYMSPSGLCGFGYLDTVRSVFTKNEEHKDVRPDNLQMARLGTMYPLNRELVKHEGEYNPADSLKVLWTESFADGSSVMCDLINMTATAENGILVGNSASTDPMIRSHMPNGPFDAKEVKTIRVWVDAPVGDNVEIYFLTEDEAKWTGNKGTFSVITKAGMNPVDVDMSAVKAWDGTIVDLRIDPLTSVNSFRLEKIEFLGQEQAKKLLVNDRELKFRIVPKAVENDYLVPFEPESGIGYNLGCAFTWDKVNKKLTLSKNNNTIVYTMNSDRITVNGKVQQLAYSIKTVDGLPMIPFEFTAKTLALNVKNTEDSINIITMSDEVYNELESRRENAWQFNIAGDMESWSPAGVKAQAADGVLYGSNLESKLANGSYDALLGSPGLNFAHDKYKTLKIRMKHDIKADKTEENSNEFVITVYFSTNEGGISEKRVMREKLEKTSDGEFIEYSFKLSEVENWNGTIKQIRIDPFNNVPGEFWIDSIVFE